MKTWLSYTAWPMRPPVPYSAFHLILALVGIFCAGAAAWKLKHHTSKQISRILFLCGILLACSEGYKQLFLYLIVNHGRYDWWYFPFQLCSLPMYLCLLLPFISSEKGKKVLYTFMQDFNLLGGIMALAEPSGLMHPYWVLTLHSFIWHFVLIFIGLLIGFGRQSDFSLLGYAKTLPLFGCCCLIASFINVAAHTRGDANMFYISPYYPSSQVVFHQVATKLGIMAGNVIYLLAICLGGFLCHIIMRRVSLTSGHVDNIIL